MTEPVVTPPAPPLTTNTTSTSSVYSIDTPDRTFTQAELDKIVQDRVARVKNDPPADYEALKAAAAELAKIQEANQSDLEKAQAATAALTAERDAAIEKAKTTALRAEVIAEASRAGAVDPSDVFALLPKDAVTVSDDGSVTGAAEAIKALLEAKPHLVGKPSTTPTGNGDGGPQGAPGPAQLSRDDLKSMTSEQITEAKAKGQLNTLLGVTTP